MPQREFTGPADWRGPEMVNANHWRRSLTPAELDELDAALQHAKSVNARFGTLTSLEFPLPTLSKTIDHIRDQLVEGPGIQLLKGFPVEKYDAEDIRLIYWGIAVHLGTPVSQSKHGDVIGDVRDMGVDTSARGGRGYTSSARLQFHCDAADVTGLFCLQTAKSGGESLIVSSQAAHNEIARTRPELLDVLYAPYAWSWRNQNHSDEKPWYMMPVFGECDGHFASRYLRSSIDFSQNEDGAPPQTSQQVEALDYLDQVINDPAMHFRMMFEPGDIQFVNNQIVYHARSEFEDDAAADRYRHLLRLWLSIPNSRALPAGFAALYRDQTAGAVRGGYPMHGNSPTFETSKEDALQH